MFAEERQQEILQLARRDGRVDVTELAAHFGVSLETVRRDLSALERLEVLRRVHGGAVPAERLRAEPALPVRAATRRVQKERIAKAALAELAGATTVLLDAGTTTELLADLLPGDRELTVVTNALPIAQLLAARTGITVMLVGGRVRPRTLATVDESAVAALDELHVDVAFLGTNGLTAARGLTTPDPAEAAVKRAMIRSGRRAVVLADSSKVGEEHFARFGTLADVERVITDSDLDPRLVAGLEAAGPDLVLA